MLDGIENVRPADIEKRSFELIQEELNARGIRLPAETDLIVRRTIHTTADFDYAETMTFSDGAVAVLKDLIRGGATIVTDTNMAYSGINKKRLAQYGGQVRCFMAEPEVAEEAKKRGVTRASVSMEKAAALPGRVVFAVGNAPTALISLREMYDAGIFRPDFVIGVPVGFVNVVPSKELIMATDIPYIINRGRKGGSNVAAAIVNAVLYQL